MKKWLGMILSVVFLASCAEMDEPREMLGENEEIVGTWVEESLEDQVTTMKRAENLAQDRYGFIIREDGTFVERKNAGWCGTPPISYDNFEGTWEALSDSLLDITAVSYTHLTLPTNREV